MKIPLQITVRDIELGEAIKEDIRQKAEKLGNLFDQIIKLRVVIEVPHRHHHTGAMYNVRIDIVVPGNEIVIKRQPHKELPVAIREAFNAAYRNLEDYAAKHRRDVKHHEETPQAYVSAIHLDEGFGFLTTLDGREIYFHENSLLNYDFDRLTVGTKVRFTEEEGEKGPQASSVTVIRGSK